jgi:two-component system cell cycle sensor histidine kinase/response regulator CckA
MSWKRRKADRAKTSSMILGETSEGEPGRAWAFTSNAARSSAQFSEPTSASVGDYSARLNNLIDLAVSDFGDWCAIDLVEADGSIRRFDVLERGCQRSHLGQGDEQCCSASLRQRVPELAGIVARVAASGLSELWPAHSESGLVQCVVIGLRVNDRTFAAVTFAVEASRPGFGTYEIAAAEQVVASVGYAIEHLVSKRDTREAVRRSQRIASQLHQLIAASITVASLRNEEELLARLADSTRGVFDAEIAVVTFETGTLAPLRGIARRNKAPVCESPSEANSTAIYPSLRTGAASPWSENDWLVAPILERRDSSRGVVAFRRESGSEFGLEDKEVLTLLAQRAASALGAAELSRTIQSSEARLRVLVETAPVGIVEVGLDGSVRWWNRRASRILGWPENDESTEALEPTFPEGALGGLRELWNEVLRGDPVSGRDLDEVDIGTRRRELTASATLLPPSEQSEQSILTLIDDVTDSRELKAELRHAHTMEVRGQVASRIAHDFNNLLTLISGYAEILARDLQDNERDAQMVRDIQATASRASLLTTQLQSIGRTKAPEPVVFDPAVVIQSNAEVIERILGGDIGVRWALDEHAGNVRVDADQFEQMILNLSINSRDAMPTGGDLSIAVTRASLESPEALGLGVIAGEYLMLSISDTGVGMDEATRKRCFEPLFTTKGPLKGTGMGLAAARRLVEESGGAIWCVSEVAEGTTFQIVLPVVDEPAEEVASAVEPIRPQGTATVLLAEDDEDLRRLMSQVLRRNGFQVLEADSGERAEAIFADAGVRIDLLLSDVIMAEMTGRELSSKLQARNPSLRVLLVSGTEDSSVVSDLMPGTCDFLAKPFRPSELIDKVHGLLTRRE